MLITLLREFVPVLFCLYAADCFSLVSPGDLAIVSHCGNRFRIRARRLLFASAFPEGMSFWLPGAPFLLGPTGAFLPAAKIAGPRRFVSSSYRFVPYESLTDVRLDGNTIHAAAHSIHTSSPTASRRAAATLTSISRASPSRRAVAVQEASRVDSDIPSIRRRRRVLFAEARGLRDPGWTVFALLFGVLPICTYVESLGFYALFALLACGASYALVLFLAVRCRRRLNAQSIPTPSGAILSMLLSPPTAARASVNLVKSGFEGFDSLAVASILLPASRLAPLLEAERHGTRVAFEEDAGPDWRAYWASRLVLCETLAARASRRMGDASSLSRLDSRSVSLCVFCRAEYTDSSIVRCEDCDFSLLPIQPTPGRPDSSSSSPVETSISPKESRRTEA